jgi:hypothetical protein
MQKVFLSTGAACLALALNGCLINRVVEVRDQFCDFDANFEFEFDESTGFVFKNPVMLEKDIIWLAGAPPTRSVRSDDHLSMIYVIEKVSGGPGEDFFVELGFERMADEFKLMNVRFDPAFSTVINQEFLDRDTIESAAQNFCETGWTYATRNLDLDISDQDLEELPGRLEILDWLGPPLVNNEKEDSFYYEYRLKSDQPDPVTASFTVWFDETTDKPARMSSRYSRFETNTDFIEKKMSMRVTL